MLAIKKLFWFSEEYLNHVISVFYFFRFYANMSDKRDFFAVFIKKLSEVLIYDIMNSLSRLVSQNKKFDVLNYGALALSLLLALNFFAWSIVCFGFNKGYKIAEKECDKEQVVNNKIVFCEPVGLGTYELLNEKYAVCGFISIIILVFILLNYQNDRILSIVTKIINISLLLYLSSVLKWLFSLKDPNLNESLISPYNSLVMDSIIYDWISVFIILTLFLIQLIELATLCFQKNR